MTAAERWESHLRSCNFCHHAELTGELCGVGNRLHEDYCAELHSAAPEAVVTEDITEKYKVPMFAVRR